MLWCLTKKISRIHLIINPAAGKGESALPVLNAALKEAGIEWEASITHKAGDAIRYAEEAVKSGVDAVAVYGGDGTIMEAASGMIGSGVPLAILPGGSANVLAAELGIPAGLAEACGLLSRGSRKKIDAAEFGGRYFLVGASVGLQAEIVKGADRAAKNRFGLFAYVWAAVAALKKAKTTVYHLTIDGREHEVRGVTCLIANTGNLGFSTVKLDKHIDVSDGLLDVVVVRKADLGLLRLLAMTLLRRERPDDLELVRHWQGREIGVSSTPRQAMQCDGEMLDDARLLIKVVPGAITVLVPDK